MQGFELSQKLSEEFGATGLAGKQVKVIDANGDVSEITGVSAFDAENDCFFITTQPEE